MKMIELVAPCHFGMEAVLKREILDLGYEISQVEDGRVTFLGDLEAVAYANVFLRTTERILIKVGKIHAETFDELFEGTKALPWEDFIPEDGKFWVAKANSIKSKLFSPSDIQSIMKKAMVERLKTVYHRERFEETGAEYPIRISILKDEVLIGLDTSGVSLHKRGYRQMTGSGSDHGDAGLRADSFHPLEKRPDSGGSLLRKRHFSHRGGYVGSKHGSGHETSFPGGKMGKSYSDPSCSRMRKRKQPILWICQWRPISRATTSTARSSRRPGPTLRMAGVDHLIHFQQRPVSELSPSEKVRLCHHKSALRRASGGEKEPSCSL